MITMTRNRRSRCSRSSGEIGSGEPMRACNFPRIASVSRWSPAGITGVVKLVLDKDREHEMGGDAVGLLDRAHPWRRTTS